MKGYKAFNKGLICNGKQYAENTVFEEKGADACCSAGMMHFCETPFDTLNCYPLVDGNGEFSEFAEVEALDVVKRNQDKRATKKLRIGAKLSFKDFIKAGISVLIETTKPTKVNDTDSTDNGGNGTQIGSSGDWAKIGSSGAGAKIGSSGDWAKIGSSGYGSKIGSSGYGAQIGSSGYGAQIGSSGYGAQIGSSGDGARIGSSGDGAKIGSSGYWAKINLKGVNSVGAAIGINSMAKGAVGNWIVLAEWVDSDGCYKPACVKAGYIDGETLKANTWYTLKNGEFTEVE